MRVTFVDLEDESNQLNGSVLAGEADIDTLLAELRTRPPFVFELRGDNGYMLQVGIEGSEGCVQYSPVNSDVPYMMAVASEADNVDAVEFALGGTPTPISRRYILPLEVVRQLLVHLFKLGAELKWWHGRKSELSGSVPSQAAAQPILSGVL